MIFAPTGLTATFFVPAPSSPLDPPTSLHVDAALNTHGRMTPVTSSERTSSSGTANELL